VLARYQAEEGHQLARRVEAVDVAEPGEQDNRGELFLVAKLRLATPAAKLCFASSPR
jgi:hypothetical protein